MEPSVGRRRPRKGGRSRRPAVGSSGTDSRKKVTSGGVPGAWWVATRLPSSSAGAKGDAPDRWVQVATQRRALDEAVPSGHGVVRYRHQRMRSGKVVWCNLCGAYAESKAVKLAMVCPGQDFGRQAADKGGGATQVLRALRKGRHPKTGAFIGYPVPEHLWHDATRLRPGDARPGRPDEGISVENAQGGAPGAARARLQAMRTRVREREACRHAERGIGGTVDRSPPPEERGSPPTPERHATVHGRIAGRQKPSCESRPVGGTERRPECQWPPTRAA